MRDWKGWWTLIGRVGAGAKGRNHRNYEEGCRGRGRGRVKGDRKRKGSLLLGKGEIFPVPGKYIRSFIL